MLIVINTVVTPCFVYIIIYKFIFPYFSGTGYFIKVHKLGLTVQ